MQPSSIDPSVSLGAKPRRYWWLRGVLGMLALAIVGPLGSWLFFSEMARREWDEAEAEADRLDPRWRLDDFLADLDKIPDEENAAVTITARARHGPWYMVAGAPGYDTLFGGLQPNTRLNERQLNVIRERLANVAERLEGARKLKDLPRGRFDTPFGEDPLDTSIPQIDQTRLVTDWLVHDACLLAHEDRMDCAVASCLAVLHAGRALREGIFKDEYLWGSRIQSEGAVAALERVLAHGAASDEALAQFQASLQLDIRSAGWVRPIRMERAFWHAVFTGARLGKTPVAEVEKNLASKSGGVSNWLRNRVPGFILSSYPADLKHTTRLVEIAKLPPAEQKRKIQEWEEASRKFPDLRPGLFRLMLHRTYKTFCTDQGTLRAAMAALACERYRVRRGRWPDSLDALVQEGLLGAVPTDPIDLQPLRYRPTPDGIVIYSIGLDGNDDGGHIARDTGGPGTDNGFRLYEVTRRRLQPAAVPEDGP